MAANDLTSRQPKADATDHSSPVRRPGQRSKIEHFMLTQRDPLWLASLPAAKRRRIEESNDTLRTRFPRPLLALIVLLEDCIRSAHGTRQKFIDHVNTPKSKLVDPTLLSAQLGGRRSSGPEEWLAKLIGERCAAPTNGTAQTLEKIARMWRAAHGKNPRFWEGPLTPATESNIADLIDPPPPAGPTTTDSGPDHTAHLTNVLNALPDALLLVDSSGSIVSANAAARQTFASQGTDVVGHRLLDLLPTFDVKLLPRLLRRTDARAPQPQPATRMVAKRLGQNDFLAEVTTCTVASGRINHEPHLTRDESYAGHELLMLVVRDLSAVADTEADLLRSQRQTEMVLRIVPTAIIGTDADERIVLVNPAAADLLGYRAADLGGRPLSATVQLHDAAGAPMPYNASPIADTLRSGRGHRVRGMSVVTSQGRRILIDLRTSPIRDGNQIVGAVMAFSDRPALEGIENRLDQLLRLLDADVAGPLRDAQEALEQLAPSLQDEPAKRALRDVKNALLRTTQLSKDVSDYHAIEAGRTTLNLTEVPLPDVVSAAVEHASQLIRPPKLELLTSVPPIQVTADAERLKVALAHLLSDFIPSDSDRREDTLDIHVTEDPAYVGANGAGHVRIAISGRRRNNNPLHIPIAEGISRRHQGVMQILENPGGGSTYVLELPIAGPQRTPDTEQGKDDVAEESKSEAATEVTTGGFAEGKQPLPRRPKVRPLWRSDIPSRPLSPDTGPKAGLPTPRKGDTHRDGSKPDGPPPVRTAKTMHEETKRVYARPVPYPMRAESNESLDENLGIRFDAPPGTPVKAVSDGVVTDVVWAHSHGYKIVQAISDGTEVTYSSLSSPLKAGKVVVGEVIAYAGAGLRLDVKDHAGKAEDAANWIREQESKTLAR